MAVDGADHRESNRSLSIKVGIIIVVLMAAGYFGFIRGRGELDQPDTPESAEPYLCAKCAQAFDLTPAGYQKLSQNGGVRNASGDDRRGGRLVLRCPKCGEFAAAAAIRCPKDQTVLPRVNADGSPPRCPKCDWTP